MNSNISITICITRAQLYKQFDWLTGLFCPIRFDVTIVSIEKIVTSNLIAQTIKFFLQLVANRHKKSTFKRLIISYQ